MEASAAGRREREPSARSTYDALDMCAMRDIARGAAFAVKFSDCTCAKAAPNRPVALHSVVSDVIVVERPLEPPTAETKMSSFDSNAVRWRNVSSSPALRRVLALLVF